MWEFQSWKLERKEFALRSQYFFRFFSSKFWVKSLFRTFEKCCYIYFWVEFLQYLKVTNISLEKLLWKSPKNSWKRRILAIFGVFWFFEKLWRSTMGCVNLKRKEFKSWFFADFELILLDFWIKLRKNLRHLCEK